MEESGFDAANRALNRIEALLQYMLTLAERSAEDTCSEAERAEMQREVLLLRRQLEREADDYEDAAVGAVAEHIEKIMEIMETLKIDPEADKN